MNEQAKSTLADLTKLLDLGYLTHTCNVPAEGGEYRFELKTLSPIQETLAYKAVSDMQLTDENTQSVYTAIELLAHSVTTVNGVLFEEFPGAQGTTNFEKKKYVLSKLSNKVIVPLWTSYQELKGKVSLDGTPEEAEEIKK